ncbi:MAG: hypothetical protein Q9169_007162 [Polycauliona sp. 2 TL-2023]
MRVFCEICCILCLFVEAFVDCQVTVPTTQTELLSTPSESVVPGYRAAKAVPGDPLSGYINRDTIIFVIGNGEDYLNVQLPKPYGPIYVYKADDVSKLQSATLEAYTARALNGEFIRWILEPHGSRYIGWMTVKRPIPDPDTRFDILAKNLLLAGVPSGLRAEVDPASLIPSPTKGCASTECIEIYPSVDVFYFGPEPTNTVAAANLFNPQSTLT